MIISSEHHDLFEQYKAAVEENEKAIKELSAYMATPCCDFEMVKKLSQHMDDTLFASAKLRKKLEEVSIKP